MILSKRFQMLTLLLGDLILFHVALALTLFSRYDISLFPDGRIVGLHKWPFFYIHLLWILVFYINGLYDIKKFPSPKIAMAKVMKTMAIAGVLAALLFYLVPFFKITPKTNLLIDVVFAAFFIMLWRRFFWVWLSKSSKIKVLFFGKSKETEELNDYLKKNAQLGYEPIAIMERVDENLADIVQQHKIRLIIASKHIMEDENAVKKLYEFLSLGISVVDFPAFYETVAEKIPVSAIGESWFLINLVEINKRTYEIFKRIFDVIFTAVLAVPTLILFPLIAALSKIESSDNIFVRQERVGKDGKLFILIKFRSMYRASETDGKAKWAGENDNRITKVGKILRKTRLDELPQFWNVLKGDMSFIGPRPERPEFVEELQKQIPHYAMRHLIKPGLSGWAQIKFPYGASVHDATEKLQYDLYYIKNRSLILDMAIALRTIATIIGSKGR